MAIERYCEKYYLGCPSWGLKDWVGHLYGARTKTRDYLQEYATVFNTVEGNTTFYSTPAAETVLRWREATPATFRFCFKLPQEITHRAALQGAGRETTTFLSRMAPLDERLGPFMIQLPPSFGPDRWQVLERFLSALPSDLQFAVEVRHRAFYDNQDEALRLNDLLAHFACERIVLDTRPLRSGDMDHPDVRSARHQKPDLPVTPTALGPHPLVRFIGHPEAAVNTPWLNLWSRTLAGWLEQGRQPYLFAHCPNDFYAPGLARRLHQRLEQLANLPAMAPWPGEADGDLRQLSLFE